MGRLEGKNAFVTGAGGAIAAAICTRFAEEGAAVWCTDMDGAAAEETARRITDAGGRAFGSACDVADETQVRTAVGAAVEALSGLNVVACTAAAVSSNGRVTDLDLAGWQHELAVNLTGVFLTCKYALPELQRAGGGSVINIASQLGSVVVPNRPAYVTTKAAVIQLSRSMAVDYATDNIRVNSLSPGAVETGRLLAGYGTMEAARERLVPLHPIGRLGQPVDIADAAVFLASDESRFMTGADLVVDGAYTAV